MAASRSCLTLACLSAMAAVLAATPAIGQEVQWRSDYTKARQEAKAKNRPLVMDVGTEHCFWCKKLDAETFRDPAVVQMLNDRFIPLRIDAERDAALALALKIDSYPTLVFAAPNSKILGFHAGFVDVARFRHQLELALSEPQPQTPVVKADGERADGTPGAPVRSTVAPADPSPERGREAQELLRLARNDFQAKHYLCCLDRCSLLSSRYPDLPEAEAARRLSGAILADADLARKTCDSLTDRLGEMYLGLAENCIRDGETRQAAAYLDRVLTVCPGSRQAQVAQASLAKLQLDLAVQPESRPIVRGQAP